MRTYTPRRCSKRWLDGDCPKGVLAIMDDGPKTLDRYTIIYAEPIVVDEDTYASMWLGYFETSEDMGFSGHGEMPAYQVAAYRYRNKHRYIRWTDLPEKIRAFVRRDLEQ